MATVPIEEEVVDQDHLETTANDQILNVVMIAQEVHIQTGQTVVDFVDQMERDHKEGTEMATVPIEEEVVDQDHLETTANDQILNVVMIAQEVHIVIQEVIPAATKAEIDMMVGVNPEQIGMKDMQKIVKMIPVQAY